MYDYGARFYMPDIGRWGVVDPRSAYTHEAYSYVWNNPIFFNDPTGMTGEPCEGCSKQNVIPEVVITVYRPINVNFRPVDVQISPVYSTIALTGSRSNNPWGWGLAGLTFAAMGIDYLWQANNLRNQIEYRPVQITYTGDNEQFLKDFSESEDDETDVNEVPVPVDDSGYKKPTNFLAFSKVARGNQRDTGLIGWSDEDIATELSGLKGNLSKEQKALKQKLVKEQKARTTRNKQKKSGEKGTGTGRR